MRKDKTAVPSVENKVTEQFDVKHTSVLMNEAETG